MKEKLTKKIYFTGQKKGRAKPVDDEMLQNIRGVTVWSRLAGTVIFWKMVIPIEAGAVKANEPKKLNEY